MSRHLQDRYEETPTGAGMEAPRQPAGPPGVEALAPEAPGAGLDVPRPGELPEWWRFIRLGPVSGRYQGPGGRSQELELRVDIDPRHAHSPVLNRVSGDFYRAFRISLPGRPARFWRNYLESWIVDSPRVRWLPNRVELTGAVRFWRGSHPTTQLRLVIPWRPLSQAGPAEATFTDATGGTVTYHCERASSAFRELTLEVDVCGSVNHEPLLPRCDTHAHSVRPAALPQRTLGLEEVYLEAGIEVRLRPERTLIDDSPPGFSSWSPAELHDAMESHFSQYRGGWPRWEMWGLMAGRYQSAGTAGIMFDAAAAFGGAGQAPERQGFALFREHSWFADLAPGTPATQAQAAAMRKFLYTWVHEAGHAFNFLHSWDKSRPDALSWMNYDWRYEARHGADSFWRRFEFRFDDEELIHLRHGDRASVIMGGDSWASGGHLEAPAEAMAQLEGEVPLELLIRSQETFDWMEPVVVELRLRNLLPDLPLQLDTRLNPEHGGVALFIRGPDGQLRHYAPVLCQLSQARPHTLSPEGQGRPGEDRFSQEVFLGYGQQGFYFDQPGEYLVRAVYQGLGDVLVPSNVHRLRVLAPRGKDEDRLAQDFFTHAVGLSLYLGGSRSRYLDKGMELLREVAERFEDSALGARAAATLANSRARPFHVYAREQARVLRKYDAAPEESLALSERALRVYRAQPRRAFNLRHHTLAERRAALLADLGRKDEARQELTRLRDALQSRGVNDVVLEDIRTRAQAL